jgi:hypothetical protein
MTLSAHLSIEPPEADAAERFLAVCRLTNAGDEDVSVNPASLSSPSLALEIQDASGSPVHLPPPPIPPAEPQTELLEAGMGKAVEFAGFLPSWTEPGTYRARFRYMAGPGDPIVSDWVEFTLTESPL